MCMFGEASVIENKGWLAGKDTVSSAVYDREDGTRVIYAVNTNWWSSGERNAEAELYFGDMHYTIDIPEDRITRIMIAEGSQP